MEGADRALDMTKGVMSPGLSGHFCPSHDMVLVYVPEFDEKRSQALPEASSRRICVAHVRQSSTSAQSLCRHVGPDQGGWHTHRP